MLGPEDSQALVKSGEIELGRWLHAEYFVTQNGAKEIALLHGCSITFSRSRSGRGSSGGPACR